MVDGGCYACIHLNWSVSDEEVPKALNPKILKDKIFPQYDFLSASSEKINAGIDTREYLPCSMLLFLYNFIRV